MSEMPILLPLLEVCGSLICVIFSLNVRNMFSIVSFSLKGLMAASKVLREYYVTEFIQCLVDQPLSNNQSNYYVPREDVYVELAVLEAVTFDEELSNSDRDSMMKNRI